MFGGHIFFNLFVDECFCFVLYDTSVRCSDRFLLLNRQTLNSQPRVRFIAELWRNSLPNTSLKVKCTDLLGGFKKRKTFPDTKVNYCAWPTDTAPCDMDMNNPKKGSKSNMTKVG